MAVTPIDQDVRDECQRLAQEFLRANPDVADHLRTGDTLQRRLAYLAITSYVCRHYPMGGLNWHQATALRQEISEVVEELCKAAGPAGM